MHRFCRCSCFITDNIFINKLKAHVRYVTKDQFYLDHRDLIEKLNESEREEIVNEILVEQQRRRNIDDDSFKRQEIIKSKYTRKYPEIFNFKVKKNVKCCVNDIFCFIHFVRKTI